MSAVHAPLTGGCLCGSVRYTIAFPPGRTYPPQRITCQCVQCRKHSGALTVHLLCLHPSQISWDTTTATTFQEFQSSPHCFRGFCTRCGSSMTWRKQQQQQQQPGGEPEGEEKEAMIDIFTGTLDAVDATLATPDEQLFCGNAVRGVTDCVAAGRKWVAMRGGEEWTGWD
ncbi:Mss4-like protein [Sphaerosporella brunnea]|uniref:Mss4-like protein n=1 Tax=Sphaerosporella brunnea TaxID=1250544 RepID=A0A5J5EEB0_9PEZI|nr:Mss4-like protein [Sphaerosporella brunnea]